MKHLGENVHHQVEHVAAGHRPVRLDTDSVDIVDISVDIVDILRRYPATHRVVLVEGV